MPAGDSLQQYPKLKFVGQDTEFTPNLQRVMASRRLVGIFVPAVMAGANLSILCSPDGISWHVAQQIHGGGDYTVPATKDVYIPLDPRVVAGLSYTRIRSDADETGLEIYVSTRAID